jgi:hypothetical protein
MVELFFKCIFTLAVLKPFIGRPPYYYSIFCDLCDFILSSSAGLFAGEESEEFELH